MKVVIPGGSGQVGRVLTRDFIARGADVTILGRGHADLDPRARFVPWDARTLGPWMDTLDGADVVINLVGKNVNCRYTKKNVAEMMSSRVDSTRVLGEAIERVEQPPRIWLQMSTATIYAHRLGPAHDEATGEIGGEEPGVPDYWKRSVEIARAWERAQQDAVTPSTRKIQLRASMIMSPDAGGIFSVLRRLALSGFGGSVGSGEQMVSWIDATDFVAAVGFLIEHRDLSGPINVAAPHPLPQREFMRELRRALGAPVGLPATAWMAEIGAFFLRTDTELLLKSRVVVPARLLDAGFRFRLPTWPEAARSLIERRANASLTTK